MPVHDRASGCRHPRLTALVTLTLAALLSVEVARSDKLEHYLAILVGALVVAAAVVGWRLLVVNTFENRVSTAAIASVALVGQLLASALGGPGGTQGPHWDAVAVAVAVLAALGFGLVVLDPRPVPERAKHPYAL